MRRGSVLNPVELLFGWSTDSLAASALHRRSQQASAHTHLTSCNCCPALCLLQDPAAVTIGGLQQQGAGGSLQQLCDVRQTGQRDHPPQPQQQQGVPAVDLQQVEQSAQPPLTASASAAQLAQCCSPQAGPAAVGSAGNVHLGTPVTGAEAFLSSSPAAVAAASVAAVYTLGAIHAADASH